MISPGETETGTEVIVDAEDVVLVVRDYGRGIPEEIETYLTGNGAKIRLRSSIPESFLAGHLYECRTKPK
jgi:hypothetical protein